MTAGAFTMLVPMVGIRRACELLGRSRAAHYRRRNPKPPSPRQPRLRPANALSREERVTVADVLHEPRFADLPPAQVWARLLDEGRYLASISTMYRVLAERGENRERRRQRTHPARQKPELLAAGPSEVWSWDIERHEALWNRAVVKGHRLRLVVAGR